MMKMKVKTPEQIVDEVLSHVDKAMFDAFPGTMVEVAKEKSPFLTGNNMNSIWFKKMKNLAKGIIGYMIGTESGYGAWLELGSSNRAPRPYFAPGYQVGHNDFMALLKSWKR